MNKEQTKSPMPFGLLWCCYPHARKANISDCFCHQCLSAFCGVVTHATAPRLAFKTASPMPFGLLWCCYPPTGVAPCNALASSPMPFGLLWCCYCRRRGNQDWRGLVTNAFRPFVVLLLGKVSATECYRPCHQCLSAFCGVVTSKSYQTLCFGDQSPMPFGLLWCCYHTQSPLTYFLSSKSPMPFGLLWCCYSRLVCTPPRRSTSHQCLSAFCGVVTSKNSTQRLERQRESPMPFGLLWCCYY